MRWTGWFRTNLGIKFLITYVLLGVVGITTVFLVATALAPALFRWHIEAALHEEGGPGGSAPVIIPDAEMTRHLMEAFNAAQGRGLLFASMVAILVSLLLSFFVARQVILPLRQIAQAARRIQAGHYTERVSVSPLHQTDELGQIAASVNELATSLEATEQKRLELIGDVAHELRTPIAHIEGFLEGLLDGVVEPSIPTWALLHTEAGRLRRLVDDLQELSRAEAHQIPLHLQAVSPARLAEMACDPLASQFEEKGLTLLVQVASDLPLVLADLDRAVQVLTNLLANALRYTPAPGSVELAVRCDERTAIFRITDTGIGLSSDQLLHIFERFYRVEKSRSRALGGSGIGLTIARSLAEAMGGQLAAESAGTGRGSTFTFTLPLAHA